MSSGFDIKAAAKHLAVGALQHLGNWIAGGIIVALGFLLTWFVSFGERSLTRLDWVMLTLGFAFVLTGILCGAVWSYPRAMAICREWFPKEESDPAEEKDASPRKIALVEAATRAYEQTKGSMPAEFAEGSADPETRNADIITWYCFYLAERIPIYGNQPPSRVPEEINWIRNRMKFNFRDGALRLTETFRDEIFYENLYVEANTLPSAIDALKALDAHSSQGGAP